MSSQLLALASSRLKNHLRAAPVNVFWNIWASNFSVAPRGCMALIYIFKWDFRQPVLLNLSKVGILNLGGNLTSGKSEWLVVHEVLHLASSLDHLFHLIYHLVDFLLALHGWRIMVSLVLLLANLKVSKLLATLN